MERRVGVSGGMLLAYALILVLFLVGLALESARDAGNADGSAATSAR